MSEVEIKKSRHLYEVLLRFNEEGKLQGAHVQYLDIIKEDGVTTHAKPGHAIPLSLLATADGLTVKKVLGDALSAVIEAKEAAVADAAAARAEFEAKDANIQALMARLADAETPVPAPSDNKLDPDAVPIDTGDGPSDPAEGDVVIAQP